MPRSRSLMPSHLSSICLSCSYSFCFPLSGILSSIVSSQSVSKLFSSGSPLIVASFSPSQVIIFSQAAFHSLSLSSSIPGPNTLALLATLRTSGGEKHKRNYRADRSKRKTSGVAEWKCNETERLGCSERLYVQPVWRSEKE